MIKLQILKAKHHRSICAVLLLVFIIFVGYWSLRCCIMYQEKDFTSVLPRQQCGNDTEQKIRRRKYPCEPQHKIGYMVAHKTASTTLQHMLFRFGYKQGLNFAIPVDSNYYGQGTKHFKASMVLEEPWHVLGYDIYAMHTRWDQKEMEKVLGPHTTYIATVRDPVDMFESLYYFASLDKVYGSSLEEFAQKTKNQNVTFPRVSGFLGRNQMLWDFGIEPSDMLNATKLKKKILDIDQNMDLVLISERFDESLILMKDILCWNMTDITYLKLNARKSENKYNLTGEARELLRTWLWADHMLYNYFYKVLEEKVTLYGKLKMQRAVQSLQEANKELFDSCVLSVADNKGLAKKYKQYSDQVLGYNLKETSECSHLGLQSWSWYKMLKSVQRKKNKAATLTDMDAGVIQ